MVLATTIAPLFGAYYCKNPSPAAALLSVLSGGISRIVMEVRFKGFPVIDSLEGF